jgi:DNA invertase Pin-like site-specific DNA recombinase
MLTINDVVNFRKRQKKPIDSELRSLPYKHAFIYGRVSSPDQIKNHHESIREIAQLIGLAKQDGYVSNLDCQEIEMKLASLDNKPVEVSTWSEGDIIINVQDLGISGQYSFDIREGLSALKSYVMKGIVGCVYLTEGVSRLSRDRDHILPYQLLKLLKDYECRIRTPDGVWNPVIDSDWHYLAEEFEDAISELKVINRRMLRRKLQKASRGEYVGEPVPMGFVLPIIGQKPSGKYEFGKLKPYSPHSQMVRYILEEFIQQNGSYLNTFRALKDLTIPFFSKKFQYMERLSSLRVCPYTVVGYKITLNLIRGIVTNLKLIGIWYYGDNEPIINNHKPVVPQDLFLNAFQLATNNKFRRKLAYADPNEWSGILKCMNHPNPIRIGSINAKRCYRCEGGYYIGEINHSCLYIPARFLDMPMTTAIFKHINFPQFTDDLMDYIDFIKVKNQNKEIQLKREVKRLQLCVQRLQALLPYCVNSTTNEVDRIKEELYWNQICEAKQRIIEIKPRILSKKVDIFDREQVNEFLKNFSNNWHIYPLKARNHLLKLIVDTVEIFHNDSIIKARIIWETGFEQEVVVCRPLSKRLVPRWTQKEIDLLRLIYLSASEQTLLASFPGRTSHAIKIRAYKLKLKRKKQLGRGRPWTTSEDELFKALYLKGIQTDAIANEIGRTPLSILRRREYKKFNQLFPKIEELKWEISDITPFNGFFPNSPHYREIIKSLGEIFLGNLFNAVNFLGNDPL